MTKMLEKNLPWVLLIVVYLLIFLQYPLGVSISRLVLQKNIVTSMQPDYLLLWGFVRISIILPLIFTLVVRLGLDRDAIYLRFGNFRKVLSVTFWVTLVFTLLGVALYPWFLKQANQNVLFILENIPIFLTFALTNAFVEEIFFRGVGLSMLSTHMKPWMANIFQAVVFALIHVTSPMASNLWLFVFLTLFLGLIWGYLTQRYRSLFPAVALHIVADIFVAISLF